MKYCLDSYTLFKCACVFRMLFNTQKCNSNARGS